MLINLSNHPSTCWPAEQTDSATSRFGEIVDLPFPSVNPEGDEAYIQQLSDEYLEKIEHLAGTGNAATIHIMGEMTFTFAIVNTLQKKGFTCVASTTQRVAAEENGMKTSEFRFKRFREYLLN
jgi:hypothetical protein